MALDVSPYSELKHYVPNSWRQGDPLQNNLVRVQPYTDEYRDVMHFFYHDDLVLYRHQNINQYGMFLIQQQQLHAVYHQKMHFVIVTRYCQIAKSLLEDALKSNLDERITSVELLLSPPRNASEGDYVLVVKCIVKEFLNHDINCIKTRDCDWYIEYVVEY